MQVYVADYTADTQHLTCEEDGAYWRLLRAMWRAGGRLPASDRNLACICGLHPKAWAKMRATILNFFTEENGLIAQKRLSEEYKKALDKASKRAAAGALGGRSKSNKINSEPEAKAIALPKHSLEPELEREERGIPDSEPYSETQLSLAAVPAGADAKKPPKKRGTRLREEWTPSDHERQLADAAGLDPQETDDAALEFRNYWCSRSRDAARIDWTATWQNRVVDLGKRKREKLAARSKWARGGRQGPLGFIGELARERGLLED